MRAVEFDTKSHSGVIRIPESYKDWYEQPVRVILLASEKKGQTQKPRKESIRAFLESIHLDLSNYRFNRDEANER